MNYNNPIKKQISLILLPIAMKKHRKIKSSMLRDLKLGRKTEIDSINGIISKYGKAVNIPTPINDTIIETVHQIEDNILQPQWDNIVQFNKNRPSN